MCVCVYVFNQLFVCGRSSQWPSSRSSGWRTGRWSPSWRQAFDSTNRSSARPSSTRCLPAAGPMSPVAVPALASLPAPSGAHSPNWTHDPQYLQKDWSHYSKLYKLMMPVFNSDIYRMEVELEKDERRNKPRSNSIAFDPNHTEPPPKVPHIRQYENLRGSKLFPAAVFK